MAHHHIAYRVYQHGSHRGLVAAHDQRVFDVDVHVLDQHVDGGLGLSHCTAAQLKDYLHRMSDGVFKGVTVQVKQVADIRPKRCLRSHGDPESFAAYGACTSVDFRGVLLHQLLCLSYMRNHPVCDDASSEPMIFHERAERLLCLLQCEVPRLEHVALHEPEHLP